VPITDEAFARAQESELANWAPGASHSGRILHELLEHSEASGELSRLSGDRTFRRGLDVGVGCFGLGFLGVHMPDRLGAIDGLDPLPRIGLTPRDPALRAFVDAIRARVNYVQSKAESIPARDASYDLVCCINVVDHAQDPPRIVREIDRVLAPGGLLLFGVDTRSLLGDWKWHIERRLDPSRWQFLAHPHTYQWRRADDLVGLVRGTVLWRSRPSFYENLLGHARMSFWILRKDPTPAAPGR
jgi:SAM-dependent methyltransferase